jgi:transcriptional regulator with XRE-family HTH domain
MTTFAERLQAAIAEHPKRPSQADLARAAGIKSSSMADWFTGKTSSANVKALPLLKAAAFLGVRAQWLLDGRGARAAFAAQGHEAREPVASWDTWPFPSIARQRFERLSERQKGMIEAFVEHKIAEAEAQSKPRAA